MTGTPEDASVILGAPLTLPCGAVLANRIAKAALSEQLGTRDHAPGSGLPVLYERWGAGGAGLVLTGNVMIDHRHLGEPRNVVIEDDRHLDALTAWAAAGSSAADSTGSQLWMQINHPGRQTPRVLDPEPVAPSAVPVRLGRLFATPRALTDGEIDDIIDRWATAAGVAKVAGFSGVQIHAAHGYLISQFLSPAVNLRDDEWGGDASRRMRFLLEIVGAVRAAVGPSFPVGVKLNSADFQRGGMDVAASIEVAAALAAEGVDLLEVSGGTYEQTAMVGRSGRSARMSGSSTRSPARASTLAREAYFLDYATQVRGAIGAMPLMLTGGFRSAAAMAEAVATGAADVVGLGRPLTVDPDLPRRILAGESAGSDVQPRGLVNRHLSSLAEIQWHEMQMHRLAAGLEPAPRRSAARVMATSLIRDGGRAVRRRRG